jgi:hypothetical protein
MQEQILPAINERLTQRKVEGYYSFVLFRTMSGKSGLPLMWRYAVAHFRIERHR